MTIEERLDELKEKIEENRKNVHAEQERQADKLTVKVNDM